MRPVLIQIGDIAIPSYGLMLVISFLAALWYVKRKARKIDILPNVIENLAFYLMLGVIVGGRLLYVIFHWEQYDQDMFGIFRIWEGGMMYFGGFIGGFLAGTLYLKKLGLSILKICDLVAPALGLGLFFTRLGCFLNGCCFGTPSNLPWAVQFPDQCVAGASPVGDQPLHPTQLYAAAFGLALFFFLDKQLNKPHYRGEIFSLYLISYGAFRFGIDFIRYYENSANFWVNQIIAFGLIAFGAIIFLKGSKKRI